jgi:hypothetical protein
MNLYLNSDYDFLVPYKVPMMRIGNLGDGGYVIPIVAPITATGLVSVGVGDNWSFEEHWLAFKPKNVIHSYDGTIVPEQFEEKLKASYNNFFKNKVRHFRENVTPSNIDIVLERGGEKVFLKLDCEGAEYKLIKGICKSKSLIGMVIEFHNLDFEEQLIQFKQAVNAICDNYKVVHVHANNYSGLNIDSLPHTLEISFLRKELCDSNERRCEAYLQDLDTPNALSSEEYFLFFDCNKIE